MAKWARRGRRSRQWVWEWVPVEIPITQKVKKIPDPFEHDDPYEIRQALAALENVAAADRAIIGEAPEG